MRKTIGQIVFKDGENVPYYVIAHCSICGAEQSINEDQIRQFSKATYIPMAVPSRQPWRVRIWNRIKQLRNLRIVIADRIEEK